MKRIGVLVFLLAGCAGLGLTQHPEQKTDPQVSEGAQLFAQNCSACHGDTAKGGRGPDLTSGQWKHGGSDAEIVRNTIKGIPGTQMPAIPLAEDEARKILAFLRSLEGKTKAGILAGNAESGERLFFGSAACSQCHMFAGRGDILGADLTGVREGRRSSEIAKKIQAPIRMTDAQLPSGENGIFHYIWAPLRRARSRRPAAWFSRRPTTVT